MKRKLIVGFTAFIALAALGGFILEKTGYEAEQVANEPDKSGTVETTGPAKSAEPEAPAIKPLSKDDVLAKFPLDSDIEPYIDAPFNFVGNRTDTADYYSLADTERYRNASVIFKDGEIASVKFIPEGSTDPVAILREFGIAEEPRKLSGAITAYEVALIPLYWSQNIEKYPFELD